MRLHFLQYLVAIADRGSMRGAGLELGVSTTAVSRALIELEDLAGVPLLERKARGVEVTGAGAAILTHARQVMRQLEATNQTLASLRGVVESRLAIGVTPWLAHSGLLGMSMQALMRRRPDVRFDVQELMGDEHRLLREGRIDIARGSTPSKFSTEFNIVGRQVSLCLQHVELAIQ